MTDEVADLLMDTPALALIAARPLSLRYSLLALLARLPQIDSLQSVEDTRLILTIVTTTQPRLIVLDVHLLGEKMRPMLEQLKAIAPHTRTVVLVDHVEQQKALQATSADLVLLKGHPAAELFASVEQLLTRDDRGKDT